MTINGISRSMVVRCSPNGVRYTDNPTGASTPTSPITAVIRADGWGASAGSGGTLSGVAPFAVFFDALDSIHPTANLFREVGYHWDFGYATPGTPGTWTYGGGNIGQDVGRRPLSHHVFETPGTYIVRLRLQDSVAAYDDAYLTVVVADPDVYWTTGGRSTVVVQPTDTSISWANNTRYQFARGGDFRSVTMPAINARSTMCLEATGAGARPLLPDLTIEEPTVSTRAWSNKLIFDGIEANVSNALPCEHVLLTGCKTGALSWGSGIDWYWGSAINHTNPLGWYRPRFITQHNCVHDANLAAGSYATSGTCSRWAIVGSELTDSVYHNLRMHGFFKSYVAHNYMHDASANYANATFRANGTDVDYTKWDEYAGNVEASRYLVCHSNVIGDAADTSNDRALTVQPQNNESAGGIEDVVVEYVVSARAAGGGIAMTCRRGLETDNTVSSYGFDIDATGEATPAEWFGPYYTNSTAANGSTIFAAPTRVSPTIGSEG